MKNKTVGIFGIVLFLIGIISIFFKNFTEINLLKLLSEYGKYFCILGGAFIGVGFLGKEKK
jgi:hypothetical protein